MDDVTNRLYVDKTRSVGSTGNVNSIKIFPFVKEFLHKCQSGVGRWSKNAKVLSTYLKNAPEEEIYNSSPSETLSSPWSSELPT